MTSGIPIATGIICASIELAWLTPTTPGDVLYVDLTVTDVVPSRSNPDRGFITCIYDTVNQLHRAGNISTRCSAAFDEGGGFTRSSRNAC